MSFPLKHLFQTPILNLRTKNKQERDLAVFGPLNIIKNISVMKSKGERKCLCFCCLSRCCNKMPDENDLGKGLSWLPVQKYSSSQRRRQVAGETGHVAWIVKKQKGRGVWWGRGSW